MTLSKRDLSEYMRKIGRRGGKKSGPARVAKLTPEQRSEIARKAVQARWAKARARAKAAAKRKQKGE